jgi:hypothetical protein
MRVLGMQEFKRDRIVVCCLAIVLIGSAGVTDAAAAETAEEEQDRNRWTNSTDLSIVVTEGNSKNQSYGFKNTLRRRWEESNFQLKFDSLVYNEADDRYLLVVPGLTWLPGEEPPTDPETTTIVPGIEPDQKRYFLEGKYEKDISNKVFWNAGGSWDSNEDAGIIKRYIAFGGLGHRWRDDEDLHFSTSYGLSATDREEDEPDPEKDDRFAGLRVGWDYLNKFGKVTTFESDLTANISLSDTADYNLDFINSVAVSMSTHLKLKVSLQWLYANEPALEDVDILARAILVDPDDTPGSGDEFFETVEDGGAELELGEASIRKDKLDTIFRTSLVVTF